MTTKPIVLATFAANGLPAIQTEITKIKQAFQQQQSVDFKLLENATIQTLANAVIDADSNLLMFHYGGHANQDGLFLENRGISGQQEVELETGIYQLDKIRLSRLLVPIEKRGVQLVFLNGCLSYGHVGVLTAKGVRAIIATNVSVNDEEAARLSGYFYQLFFEKGFTLKQAFETAETTVRGNHSYPIIVNPGEMDDNQPMQSSWTLFVNAQHNEVMNWKLEDFISHQQEKRTNDSTKNNAVINGNNNIVIQDSNNNSIVINKKNSVENSTISAGGNVHIGDTQTNITTQNADKIYNIDHIDNANFS